MTIQDPRQVLVIGVVDSGDIMRIDEIATIQNREFSLTLTEAKMPCPPATGNLQKNTENRNRAIQADHIQYGPLNVDEPEDYWKDIADFWSTTEKAAKSSLCGNCTAFDISPRMKDCLPGPTSDEDGELGYCWMHHFKCHSARSCRTWAKGGPIAEDKISYDWQKGADFEEVEDEN